MSLLDEIGVRLGADKSSIFHNYLPFYEEQLPDRSFTGRLLEIGVMDGLSMRMWAEYYPKAEIIGIDIKDMSFMHNSDWKVPESVQLIRCDGTDERELRKLGRFDVILDDGGHFWSQQQKSFEILYYNQLDPDGIYVIEDLWTSHIDFYADAPINTIQYLKNLEEAGMEMTHFKHKHDGPGIETVFPGYEDLESHTVVIRGGQ